MNIDVYPVGILRDVQHAGVPHGLKVWARYVRALGRQRNWWAIKNTFNGYLAEPAPWPPRLQRCGTGWTKRRALLDLQRKMRRAG